MRTHITTAFFRHSPCLSNFLFNPLFSHILNSSQQVHNSLPRNLHRIPNHPIADEWTKFAVNSWYPRPLEDLDVDGKNRMLQCLLRAICTRSMATGVICPYPLAVGHEIVGKVLKVWSYCHRGARMGERSRNDV
ncbi:hypothetical protein ASPBRDRAFT_599945 [Aspergillus brasiliensis CBS 101740]|uniref:Uncharacterized protein n=1 Tax=Aspergillus brasiliensis (strain CBS 101740 / IMI 381727 / IBT 21946) TaxID=767769 RepID=A0A1L9UHB6_ASPBC|nr:hypothetical protein ASPBRDRAFT_599945 [Aspergillus brasiliensis CBS 101740]